MAMDGILLHKIIPILQANLPFRIQKIWHTSETELLFQIHGCQGKKQLLINLHSAYNRLLLSDEKLTTADEPLTFVMLLRKYLDSSIVETIQQIDLDRWFEMKIKAFNTIGDIVYYRLIIELMGKYANCILVDDQGKVIDALKRIPPFTNTQRIIQPGAMFKAVEKQAKKNPFTIENIDPDIPLFKQCAGFSPLLANECEYRMQCGQSFKEIMQEINHSQQLFFADDHDPNHFHCLALKHLGNNHSYPLQEGLAYIYKDLQEQDRIKHLAGDILKFIQREKKHQARKLPRLKAEYDQALDCQRYLKYGNLLYMNQIQDTKGLNFINLQDDETDHIIKIPLDPKLDGKANARKMFQIYNKKKKGQAYLQTQIAKTQIEYDYFLSLEEQLSYANVTSAKQIQAELIRQGYIKKKVKGKNKKEEKLPVYTLKSKNDIVIRFGKNCFQNEIVTWHSPKSFIWLHAQNYHGAHVVIESNQPDEETLRLAANIAAYFSAGRFSSSVPVNYCPIKALKKIPGAKPGMVQLSAYKTIYIDPDITELKKYELPI